MPAIVTAVCIQVGLAGTGTDDQCLGSKPALLQLHHQERQAALNQQAEMAGMLQPLQSNDQADGLARPPHPVNGYSNRMNSAASKPRRFSACVGSARGEAVSKPRRNSSSSVACQTLPVFAVQKLQQQQQQPQPPAAGKPVEQVVAPVDADAAPQQLAGSTSMLTTVKQQDKARGRAAYSSGSYWNDRYAEKSTHFDWFYSYSALASLIRLTCSTSRPCLHVGCGNSGISHGMVQDGYEVVNVDISPVVIEQMRLTNSQPRQSWEVADCRAMPQFANESFTSVIDKGTLDAVLCSSHGQADTQSYVNEVHRVLAPGGVFLLISLAQPQARLNALRFADGSCPVALPYLSSSYQQQHAAAVAATAGRASSTSGWQWGSIQVYLLPKPALYLASEASLTGKQTACRAVHNDKDMPVDWLGPYAAGEELDAAVASEELDLREFFTAFLCTKAVGADDSVVCDGSA